MGAVNHISHTPLSQAYVIKVSSINSIASDKKNSAFHYHINLEKYC